jgi:hypothetical protein
MTQRRLNAVAVCNVHRELVDDVDLSRLAEESAELYLETGKFLM